MSGTTGALPAAIIPFMIPAPPEPPLPPTETYITMYIKSIGIVQYFKNIRVKGRKITNDLGTTTITIKGEEDE